MSDSDDNKLGDSTSVLESPTPHFKKNFCKYCGKELQPDAAFCSSCGRPQNNVIIQQPAIQLVQQPVVQPYVNNPYLQSQPIAPPNVTNNTTTVVVDGGQSNSIGTAGFIIALLGLVFCWVPVVNLILWLLGLIFSVVGLFKSPRGMAIAGLVLSIVLVMAIIAFMGAAFSFLGTLFNK